MFGSLAQYLPPTEPADGANDENAEPLPIAGAEAATGVARWGGYGYHCRTAR